MKITMIHEHTQACIPSDSGCIIYQLASSNNPRIIWSYVANQLFKKNTEQSFDTWKFEAYNDEWSLKYKNLEENK